MALFIALHVGGFILLVASIAAVFFNGRLEIPGRPAPWMRLWTRRWEVGLLLGLLSVFSLYPVYDGGKWFTIWGIPFLVVVTGGGEDHPRGPGCISTALNFAFWLLLPQFVLWVTSGRGRGARVNGPSGD